MEWRAKRQIGFVRLFVLFPEGKQPKLNLRLHQDGFNEKGKVGGRNRIFARRFVFSHRKHYCRQSGGGLQQKCGAEAGNWRFVQEA